MNGPSSDVYPRGELKNAVSASAVSPGSSRPIICQRPSGVCLPRRKRVPRSIADFVFDFSSPVRPALGAFVAAGAGSGDSAAADRRQTAAVRIEDITRIRTNGYRRMSLS